MEFFSYAKGGLALYFVFKEGNLCCVDVMKDFI